MNVESVADIQSTIRELRKVLGEIPILASERSSVSWMLRVAMEKKSKRKSKRNQKPRVVEDQRCWLMERMRRRLKREYEKDAEQPC